MTDYKSLRLEKNEGVVEVVLIGPGKGNAMGPDFWREAVPLYPSRNRRLARLRLDPEILDWFASRKEDPHAGINAVLRAYVERRRAGGQGTA